MSIEKYHRDYYKIPLHTWSIAFLVSKQSTHVGLCDTCSVKKDWYTNKSTTEGEQTTNY